MNPQLYTYTIAAGSVQGCSQPGKVLTVKSCTLPINVQFDGGSYQQIASGAVQDLRPDGFGSLVFQNPSSNGVAVTVVFWIGDAPVAFSPQDNSNTVAPTYVVGNLGIANGAAASGNNPACSSGGLLSILTTKAYTISATDPATGHGRQQVTFSVDSTSIGNLIVSDPNGNTVVIIKPGGVEVFVTSAAFQIQASGGTALVSIGQYYSTTN